MRRRLAKLVLLGALGALAVVSASAAAAGGDILVGGDDGANTVLRIKPNGHHQTVAQGSPLTKPGGLDFAPNGSIFVADYGLTGVIAVDPASHSATTLFQGSPFASATDVVRGPDGKLYVTDGADGAVFRMSPSGGTPVLVSSNTPGATGITLDGRGNLLVAGDGVFEVNRATGATKLVPGTDITLSGGAGIARTPSGTVYVDVTGDNTIHRVSLKTGAVKLVAKDGFLDTPYDMDLEPNGKLLVAADASPNARIVQVDPKHGTQKVIDGGTLGDAAAEGVRVEPPSCGGKLATIVGSNKSDALKGTKFDDVIAGLDGKDKIDGLGGNDVICGGGGADKLFGDSGKDKLNGGAGQDKCVGGPGRDHSTAC